jgi:adenine phosphoribosyltransferase
MDLHKFVREVPDFPKEGVLFRDLNPLFANPQAFAQALDELGALLPLDRCEIVAGIELRGAVLASALAAKFSKGFLPVRKAGKLPPPTLRESCALEYGQAELEIYAGRGRVVLVDDVLATGGTLGAAIRLLERGGYSLEGLGVLVDLISLNDLKWKTARIPSVLKF